MFDPRRFPAMFLVLFWLALGIPSSHADVAVVASTANDVTLRFSTPHFEITEIDQDGTSVQRVAFAECAYTTAEGLPRLPMQSRLLGIPLNANVTVAVVKAETTQRSWNTPEIVPRRITRTNAQGELVTDLEPSHRADVPALYPPKVAAPGILGFVRDQQVLQVHFYPAQYLPAQHQLRLSREITVRVTFQQAQAAPSTGIPRVESSAYEQSLRKMLLNYDEARAWRQPRQQARLAAPIAPQVTAQTSLKVGILDEGMYHLTYQELKDAGVPLKGLDPRTFKMVHRGRSIPIFVRGEYDQRFDVQDEIVFYGQQLRGEEAYHDPYTFENVYWLTWGGNTGRRMAKRNIEVPAEQARPYSKYRFLVHAEQENSFTRLGEVNDTAGNDYIPIRGGVFQRQNSGLLRLPPVPADSWFWESIPHSSVREYNIELPGVAETSLSASVRVMLHGLTSTAANPDHHTVLWINGERQLDDTTWDGQTPYFFQTTKLSQDFLRPGENELIVMNPGDTQAQEVDQILFNWFEIEYWRNFEASEDTLAFSIPATDTQPFQVVLSNFASPEVEIFGVDGSLYTDNLILADERTPGTYLVRFIGMPQARDPQDPTIQYIALTRDRLMEPQWVEMNEPSELRSPANGADYLIIAHASIAGGTQPLAEWREQQGYRVQIVTTQDIYDEFNDGIFNPLAIRDFLAYAYEHWQAPAPSYVLLVGDANLRYRTEVNYVPSILVQSPKYGATASDHQFVTFRGEDAFPDMAIGRIPVRNHVDLNVAIQKLLSYERAPERGPWRRNLLFLSGTGGQFSEQTETLIQDYMPLTYQPIRIYAGDPDSELYGGAREVLTQFNEGPMLINFIGHGGGSIWSDNRMLGLEDIPLLENGGRLPFVISMTCFTGYFDNPYASCLGEEMLKTPEGGAIAFFGNTGLGWLWGDYYLSRKMYQNLFQERVLVLGDLVGLTKTAFLTEYPDYVDLAEMFTLFGDPATRLGLPEPNLHLESLPIVDRNSLVPISGSLGSNFEGEVDILATDAQGRTVDQLQAPVTAGGFRAQLSISSVAETGAGVIRAYAWNETDDAVGMATYAINSPHVYEVTLSETVFSPDTTPQLSARIATPSGVAQVNAYWSLTQTDWENIPMSPRDDNRFETIDPLPKQPGGRIVYYYVAVTDSEGTTVQSPTRHYEISNYPDLSFAQATILRRASVPQMLATQVKNRGELTASNVTVRFYEDEVTAAKQLGDDAIIAQLAPGEVKEAAVPWQPSGSPEAEVEIHVVLDPESRVKEFNENNNQLSQTLHPNRFVVTALRGTAGPIASLDGKLRVEIPGGVIAQDSVLAIETVETIPITAQPDLQYVDAEAANYQLALLNKDQAIGNLTGQITILSEQASGTPASHQTGIYYYDTTSEHWIRISDAQLPDGNLVGTLSGAGRYALLRSTDHTPPEISLTVEHQGFIDGSYVSSSPVISAIVNDANGIDTREQQIHLFLDKKEIARSEYAFESAGSRAFLSYAPTLDQGSHTLSFQISDANGNPATANADMQVNEELAVDKVANFPNPFEPGRRERNLGTMFAYVLTGEADKVSLKIYTVTGRLIKTLKGLDTAPDYNEYHWDGLDSDDEELPNGVYLYQFVAERDGKTTKKTGKLAILR